MHWYFELSLEQVFALETEEFLSLCEQYLHDALAEEGRRDVDRQGREYARTYLGIDVEDDLESLYGR